MFTLVQYSPSRLTKVMNDTCQPKAKRVLARVARIVLVWLVRSRSRAALKHLTSEQLQDIGLTHREALDEAAKWFWKS